MDGTASGVLAEHDLTTVFQVGWTRLSEQVVLGVPRRLIGILSGLDCADGDMRDDIQVLCDRLRRDLAAGTPWRARDSLDPIAILDPPSWAILVRLIDECPVVPRDCDRPRSTSRPALRAPAAFEFISDNRQIAWTQSFVESLPARLLS